MSGSPQAVQRKTFEGESPEQKALGALAWMADQYLTSGDGTLDNLAMGPGELALEVLAEHGLVTLLYGGVRFANWTDEGRMLLARYE